jgi:hypothetical protein
MQGDLRVASPRSAGIATSSELALMPLLIRTEKRLGDAWPASRRARGPTSRAVRVAVRVVPVGLGLNAVFGSGWADPVATPTVASLR